MDLRLFRRLVCIAAWAFGGSVPAVALSIASPAFSDGGLIPPQYARVHDNLSPPLTISGVPPGTKSLALIVDDPDAPAGLFTHWLLWNIPPDAGALAENAPPAGAAQGRNSFGDARYDGPAPPNGRHRYFFHLYALDAPLDLAPGADRAALEAAMQGHVIARAKMFGTFATGQ